MGKFCRINSGLSFSCFLIAVAIIAFFFRYKKSTAKKKLPPGPWNLPILGYLPWLNPKQPQISLTQLSKKYGPIYGLYMGSIYTVVISDVKLLKRIFFKDAASGRAPLYMFNKVMHGKGIIFTEGDLWRDQRKFLHTFLRDFGAAKVSHNRNEIENDIMTHILNIVQCIKNQGKCVVLQPKQLFTQTIASIITTLLFGKTWSHDDETLRQLLGFLDRGSELMGVAAPLNFFPSLNFLPQFKKKLHYLLDALQTTHTVFKKIISDNENLPGLRANLSQAFLAEKIKRSANSNASFYTDDQLNFLLSDIFGAGIKTTANSINWLVLLLAVHQEVQDRVREELLEVLNNRLPTLKDMENLPYTQAAISEVLRFRSVVPLGVPHGNISDIELENFTIPKGTMIVPLMWAIHMDPRIWTNPDDFRPERFLNEEGDFYKPEAFIPFQIGKRMCVGEEFAKMNLFLFVATIIQNFKIECEDYSQVDLTGISGMTLAPKPHRFVFTSI